MTMVLPAGLRNNIVADYKTRIDAYAGASATLSLYSGTRPVFAGSPPTALVVFTCGATFFGAQAGAVLPINTPGAQAATAGGGAPGTLATWARLATSGGSIVADMNVSQTGATAGPDGGSVDITMNDPHIVFGATITPVNNLTYTVPL